MQVYGQLQNATFEVLSSDPSASTQGRFWYNSTTAKFMLDDGSVKAAVLRNDQHFTIGTSGTASNNVRINRAGNAVLQFVTGDDTTAQGSLSTSLAKLDFLFQTYTLAALPSAGHAGRIFFVSDHDGFYYDDGSIWQPMNGIITGSQIASSTITGTNIANNINLPGNTVQENGKNVVVSSTNDTTSLAIIRGSINADGSIAAGAGFTVTRNSAGNYTINFSVAFASTPSLVCSLSRLGTELAQLTQALSVSTTSANVISIELSHFFQTDAPMDFIVIGPR